MRREVLESLCDSLFLKSQASLLKPVCRHEKTRCQFWGSTGFANVTSLVLSKLGQPSVTSDVDADLNGHQPAYSRLVIRYNPHFHQSV